MATTTLAQSVEAIHRFNRFYTQRIGLLTESYLSSPFSLAEAQVIYELAHRETTTAPELGNRLDLDIGYLSRILDTFKQQGLIENQPSPTDSQQSIWQLTEQGQAACTTLNAHAHTAAETIVGGLSTDEQHRLVEAMQTIEQLLGREPAHKVPYIVRPHQPGDMGWILHRHAIFYAQEYGWVEECEAFVARIVTEFIEHYDAKRERCWVVEMNGALVGCVFLVKKTDMIAQLRLLFVEPKARRRSIGTRLVDECIRFARNAGYGRIMLWTYSALWAARLLYEQAGFHLVHTEPLHNFGQDLIGETWELDL